MDDGRDHEHAEEWNVHDVPEGKQSLIGGELRGSLSGAQDGIDRLQQVREIRMQCRRLFCVVRNRGCDRTPDAACHQEAFPSKRKKVGGAPAPA